MKMIELEKHAQICLHHNRPLQVLVSMPNLSPELIINPPENIHAKMDYFKAVYDENGNHKHAEGYAIVDVVDSAEPIEGESLLRYSARLLENHIRVEDSYTIGERCKTRTFEGDVEDVLKALAFFGEEKGND